MNNIANTDTTYCINNTCTNKCWRHMNNWKFDADKNYIFTSGLEDCGEALDDADTVIAFKEAMQFITRTGGRKFC